MSRFKSAQALRRAAAVAVRHIVRQSSDNGSLRRRASIEALELRQYLSRPLGIDVSHYQGTINWASVHSAGKTFAFVKATEGTSITDEDLTANMANGTAAGMLLGVYHHATPSTTPNDAINEADYFAQVAGSYMTAGYLRPGLDISASTLSASDLSTWVNTFESRLQADTGC